VSVYLGPVGNLFASSNTLMLAYVCEQLACAVDQIGAAAAAAAAAVRTDNNPPNCLQRHRRCTRLDRLQAFYRAMLCIRGTSHGPVCVCLSVRSRSSTKTAKRRITQTTPHNSPGTLVFGCQRSPQNSTGITPCGGAKCRWGGSKSATFDK